MPRMTYSVGLLLFALIAPPLAAQAPRVQGILLDVVKDETTPTGSILVAIAPANVNYALFEGSFLTLPKFSELKPTLKGQMYGFDLAQVIQQDAYAMTFDSFLKIEKEGTYKFFLTSDDGSRLTIGDKVIVNNDGMHAQATATGEVKLSAGMHNLQLAYFQNFGTSDLRLQYEGPGVTRRDVATSLYLTADVVKPSQQQNIRFIVNQSTVFETVRGGERRKVNFLKEHRGERVDVLPLANSDPLVANKVDILLPLPPSPPAHVKVSPGSGPRPIFGTVVDCTKAVAGSKNNSVTIRLHDAPPPVLGVVTDVSVSADKEVGTMVVKTDGKNVKFVVPARARVAKWKGFDQQPGSFLSVERGQTLLVYSLPNEADVCTKVDIMEVPAEAFNRARYHHRHHNVTFLTTPETEFMRFRDGRALMAGFSSVEVGEEVGFIPAEKESHVARKVEVFLPPTIFGVVTAIGSDGLTLMVGNQERIIPINAATNVDIVENKMHTAAGLVALAVGQKVAVFPAGPAPHWAEKVAIDFYRYVVKGQLLRSESGSIVVQVRQPAEGGNPARDSKDTFQVRTTTKYEIVRGTAAPEPATEAALTGAKEVTIRVLNLVPPLAERVTIMLPPAPPVTAPQGIAVKGHVSKVGQNSVTIKIQHNDGAGKPPRETTETFKLTSTTTFELHRGKKNDAATVADVKVGREVLIQAHGSPAQADRLEIFLPGSKSINATGTITAVGNGLITINNKDGNHTFQLTPNTKIELGTKAKAQPGDLTALQLGRTVTIHAHVEAPNTIAEKIEVKDKKKK